jgi:hypothetical protein
MRQENKVTLRNYYYLYIYKIQKIKYEKESIFSLGNIIGNGSEQYLCTKPNQRKTWQS